MRVIAVVACAAALLAGSMPVGAADCPAATLANVVDETAAALRSLNNRSERDFRDRLAVLGAAGAWSDAERVSRAEAAAQDERVVAYSQRIESLLARIDQLSRAPTATVDCARVEELKRGRDDLLIVMGQKSGAMLASLDTARPPAQIASPPAEPKAPKLAPRPVDARPTPTPTRREPAAGGETAALQPLPEPRSIAPQQNVAPPQNAPMQSPQSPAFPEASARLYTMDEIRDAGRGIFGTLSAEFAAGVNYAFQSFGQPNGYIIGNEGGGAFLAGLRYGKGTLHQKNESARPVHWQGPSLGLDAGAEGSRTMFLVYNLDDPETLFARFTGLGGSAYVAGGLGITVLTNGTTTLVPIKTGLGLRIGANLSYLKFTPTATWNPF